MNWLTQHFAGWALLVSAGLFAACGGPGAARWPGFDALEQPRPDPPRVVGGASVSEEDYQRFVRWGADWFRYETFGGERTVTDLVGLLNAPIEVPCDEAQPDSGCFRRVSSRSYVARAIDDLDGVRGNLYTGNGGKQGRGFTQNLVLRFPKGSRLHGLPLPEAVHTGLDVEAGEDWPIGISAIDVIGDETNLPYIWDLEALGAGPVEGHRYKRIGITCALCHFSLDVDWDGRVDLRSAQLDEPTPGSPYRPEHSWAVGNQDLKVGWLFAMSQNPLVGFAIFGAPIGNNSAEASMQWVRWVKSNYRTAPEMVTREVARSMILQPRGYADISSNSRYNGTQFPALYTQHYWPSNSDGAIVNGNDRNSVVWTTTMDFAGLVGLAGDRGGSNAGTLYWEEASIYSQFTAFELAELMTYSSPAALHDPRQREVLRDDILGVSDGVPGLLDPASVYVMQGPGNIIPPEILNHPKNKQQNRIRQASDYGGDAEARGPLMALLGVRAHTRPEVAKAIDLASLTKRYPRLNPDEIMGDAVNTMLDWQPSPPNLTERLARARDLVPRGYELFKELGCAECHSGPFFTDNRIHRFSDRRRMEIGIAAPSTSGWRSLGRGSGPAIESEPLRTLDSRVLYLYVAPSYDPETGLATGAGGPLRGLFGNQVVGYKTTQLRYVWGTAPYLHDGGVGVAIAPSSSVDRDDLLSVLRLPDSEKVYGMGAILAFEHQAGVARFRPDAALSLQALLLPSERMRVLMRAQDRVIPVPGVGDSENPLAAPSHVSALDLGIYGVGHDFFVDDEPGGERVSALIAFLLSLDDDPGQLPERRN